ncbi:MAG: EamA family transporter [Armatimonadetes bacterium]|nr:EamA family transporter [Armatimonadota bacterium]
MSVNDMMLLLFSAATWGGWAFLTKIASTELSSTTTQVMSWSGSALVVLTLCTKGFELRFTPPYYAAIVAGILVALGNLCYFKASRHVPVSIAYPIVALHVLVPVVLGVLLLGEKLSPQKGLGIVCALVAILLLIRS